MYAYFGHHKCASVWVRGVVKGVCARQGLRWVNPKNREELLAETLDDSTFLLYANANQHVLADIDEKLVRGFHVVRDPRDIVVSAYYSHRYSHGTTPWLDETRKALERSSQEEGLRRTLDQLATQWGQMAEWPYSDERIYETRFEQLTVEPLEEFTRVFEFLGLDVPLPALRSVLENKSFKNMSGGREPGQEAADQHFRKGVSGDWKTHLTGEVREYARDRIGPLVERLGYGGDGDW